MYLWPFDLPKWVSIDADIFYKRMCFEEGFHLAQADILAKLKLNQVLLAVDDSQSTWKTQYVIGEVRCVTFWTNG